MSESPRIIYITRKFPPSVGGMQWYNFYLCDYLSTQTKLELIALRGSQAWLPLFLIFATLKSVALLSLNRKSTVVILGDAALAPLGFALQRIFRVRVFALVHGLDVIYPRFGYPHLVLPCLRKLDGVFCNSRGTATLAEERGVASDRITLARPGVNEHALSTFNRATARQALQLAGSRESIILLVGRLIPRKGALWFVKEVLPKLREAKNGFKVIIVGEGPEHEALETELQNSQFRDRVLLTGQVSDEMLASYYRAADIFVMPNIVVENDFEGFGLVSLEAAANGAVVIAADLSGIAEAVHETQNGFLLPPGDSNAFASKIIFLLSTPEETKDFSYLAQAYTLTHFRWEHTAATVLQTISPTN